MPIIHFEDFDDIHCNWFMILHLIRAAHLLHDLPEAVGTMMYMNVMKSVINSFLDKSLSPEDRIEEMWYGTFFVRYWRHWVITHPTFNLQNNFITNNAYMCIEINAHALIAFVYQIQLNKSMDDTNFLPWFLGSQSCERLFRSLRSMSSTFSTMVNFSLYGMLQRLHKLQIQEECHSKVGDAAPIRFPRQERYGRRKDGDDKYRTFSVSGITEDRLYEIMKKAETRAQERMVTLGMEDSLRMNDKWIPSPIATHLIVEENVGESSDDDSECGDGEVDPFVNSNREIIEIEEDVDKLDSSNAIDVEVKNEVKRMRKKMPFNKSNEDLNLGIAVYKKTEDKVDNNTKENHQFLKLEFPGREDVYIRKRTAIWLLQNTERVSSDRLFRVRSKQPFTQEKTTRVCIVNQAQPAIMAVTLTVGDLCIFKVKNGGLNFKVGRVMHFIKIGNRKKHAQYKGKYVEATTPDISVMCTIYEYNSKNNQCTLSLPSYEYLALNCYLCTLTSSSISDSVPAPAQANYFTASVISVKNTFTLKDKCVAYIRQARQQQQAKHSIPDDVVVISDSPTMESYKTYKKWVTCHHLILTQHDRNILLSDRWLNDKHIEAAQTMLKKQFEEYGGLQSTVNQLTKPLTQIDNCIQIIHVQKSHWAVITTIGTGSRYKIKYYDSSYAEIFEETERVIANLIPSPTCTVEIDIMMTRKQVGTNDCGLFAIAIATTLANREDPSTLIYIQDEMRAHLANCFQQQKLTPFPTIKKARVSRPILNSITIYTCPICKQQEGGKEMVECDKCNIWHHTQCSPSFEKNMIKWYCPVCETISEAWSTENSS